MSRTKIPWSEFSYNPIIGCSKVSEGCENCYAERMAERLAYNPVTPMYSDVMRQPSMMSGHLVWNGTTAFVESALNKPLKRKKPTMFFVCSMGDFWHPSVRPEWRERVYDVVRHCQQHIFQFLTKRPENIKDWPDDLPNAWLGVTAENQEMADRRIPILSQIPAAERFVSLEPMLEGVEIEEYLPQYDYRPTYEYYRVAYPDCEDKPIKIKNGIDWVIVGCESGSDRRPCDLAWVKSVVDQCDDAEVPVFVKQLSIGGKLLRRDPKTGEYLAAWPEHLRRQEMPGDVKG